MTDGDGTDGDSDSHRYSDSGKLLQTVMSVSMLCLSLSCDALAFSLASSCCSPPHHTPHHRRTACVHAIAASLARRMLRVASFFIFVDPRSTGPPSPFGTPQVDRLMPDIDPHTAASEWWTPANETDTSQDLAERFDDFMCTLRYTDAESIIVVGHSLFFMEFVNRYLSAQFDEDFPQFSAELRCCKLTNAACLGLRLDFTGLESLITDAQMMFDTKLHPAKIKGQWFGWARRRTDSICSQVCGCGPGLRRVPQPNPLLRPQRRQRQRGRRRKGQ